MTVAEVVRAQSRAQGDNVVRGDFLHDDPALVDALLSGHPGGPAALFDAYGEYVERLLVRVLGQDPEIEDLLHEVFAEALTHIKQLRDPSRLKAWLTRITVFRARGAIRHRRRRRWLVFRPAQELPVQTTPPPPHETRDLLERVFTVLQGLHANERVAFSLRYIEGMTLQEAAVATGVSLATFKRRLKKSDEAFLTAAKNDPVLYANLEESPRWRQK